MTRNIEGLFEKALQKHGLPRMHAPTFLRWKPQFKDEMISEVKILRVHLHFLKEETYKLNLFFFILQNV
jgi:hypothetical protein